jgi:hypothetical protein
MSWDVHSACGWLLHSRRRPPAAARHRRSIYNPLNPARSEASADSAAPPLTRAYVSARPLSFDHDFGVVPADSVVRHVFAVENPSMQPWTIASISRSCICTVATATAEVVAPGSAEEFEVVYRAGGKSADFEQSIEVRFSEPEAPTVVFRVRGQIRRPLTSVPPELRFGPIRSNEEASAWLEVENHSGSAWSDLTAAELPAWLHVRGQAVRVASLESSAGTKARERWRIEFVAADRASRGTDSQGILGFRRVHGAHSG